MTSHRKPCDFPKETCAHDGHRHLWASYSITDAAGTWDVDEDGSNLAKASSDCHGFGCFLGGTINVAGRVCCTVAVIGSKKDGGLRLILTVDQAKRVPGGNRPIALEIYAEIASLIGGHESVADAMRESNMKPKSLRIRPASYVERAHVTLARNLHETLTASAGERDANEVLVLPTELVEQAARKLEEDEKRQAREALDSLPEDL